jgi:methionyl aminopeptidase
MAHEHSHDGHDHAEVDEEHWAEYLAEFEKAGEICKKAKEKMLTVAKPGVKLIDLAEGIEAHILELGGKPAFPVNLSANNRAAHYTPAADDATVISEKDLLKIDFGVHLDGCIVDNSVTVDFSGENGKLVEAAKEALANALGMMKAGVNTADVGKVIEETVKKRGFKPIENLCGHSIMPWQLHAGVEVPNVGNHGGVPLEEGMVYAVEPFVSTGEGRVKDDPDFCEIYSLSEPKSVRLPASRKVLDLVIEEYQTLPFARRWLQEVPMLSMALSDLQRQGVLHGYNLLREAPGTLISQAETSVIIEEDGVKVLV